MRNGIINIDKRQQVSVAGTTRQPAPVSVASMLLYALPFIGAAAAISFFLSRVIIPGNTNYRAVIIPTGSFVCIGLLFTAFLYNTLRFLNRSDYEDGIVYAIVVAMGVFAASFMASFFKGNVSVVSSLFYSSLFILPFTIYQSWLCYSKLLFFSYSKVWYLPEKASEQSRRTTIFLNSIHIKIKIPSIDGGAEYVYETTVPGRMSVGEMFNDVVNSQISVQDYNDAFEEVNVGNYGWQFFVPQFLGLGSRLVDAEVSLDQNKIKDNGVVVARRIPKQLTVAETINKN